MLCSDSSAILIAGGADPAQRFRVCSVKILYEQWKTLTYDGSGRIAGGKVISLALWRVCELYEIARIWDNSQAMYVVAGHSFSL